METKEDFAFGVVPLYNNGSHWEVLLVHQISYRGDDFWILPKGHKESGESSPQTALRELKEETGVIRVALNESQSFPISYSFMHEGTRISKTVEYWVGYCESQDTEITQPQEIKELKWCTFSDAIALATHQNSKEVLAKVQELLASQELAFI